MPTIFSETTEFSKCPNQTSYLAPKEKRTFGEKEKESLKWSCYFDDYKS